MLKLVIFKSRGHGLLYRFWTYHLDDVQDYYVCNPKDFRKLRRQLNYPNVIHVDESNASHIDFKGLYLEFYVKKLIKELPRLGVNNDAHTVMADMMEVTEQCAASHRLDLINLLFDSLELNLKPLLLTALLRSCSRFKKHITGYNRLLDYAHISVPNPNHVLRGITHVNS